MIVPQIAANQGCCAFYLGRNSSPTHRIKFWTNFRFLSGGFLATFLVKYRSSGLVHMYFLLAIALSFAGAEGNRR